MGNFTLIAIDWIAVGVAIAIVAAVLIWIWLWRDRFRPLDWLLMLLALGALLAGLLMNGPLWEFVSCPEGPCLYFYRLPIELASGATVAVIALLIVAIRVRPAAA